MGGKGRPVHRFFFVVRDTVRRYQGDDAVAWSFTAELYADADYQRPLAYCGHDHRDPDKARECGNRLLRKAERGDIKAHCSQSFTGRHVVRSDDTCVYCGTALAG